tara:strand:+ start:113 stop:1168 length:1056 start_codon:yes stop_codon:yes gene_type:complete
MKKALISGITGQDGAYLAKFLLDKGYQVHGIKRRSSSFNTERIESIYQDPHLPDTNLFLHYGDLSDSQNITKIIDDVKPDEIYNLGAQSHVGVSFEMPIYTSDIDGLGVIRMLEGIRTAGIEDSCKFYQASTSELYGKVQEIPQNENTPFYPRSPYAVAKLMGFWATVNYRESYGIFACNGILFNHESPFRGETFVTRKITRALTRIKLKIQDCLYIGNLDAMRDWGHAKDYVEMQWMMLQIDQPEDFVIASGIQHSVRDFIEISAKYLDINISWQGSGLDEVGVDANGSIIIRVDERYFRPAEVETLLGDPSKAKQILQWEPKISFHSLVEEMTQSDLDLASQEKGLVAD